MEGPEVFGETADSGGGVTDMPYIDIGETPVRKPAITFEAGYELEYAVDPDGLVEIVFTADPQEGSREGEEAA